MVITIHTERVAIVLENDVRFDFTFYQLDQVEKAIEIIRNLNKIEAFESATITII